ncbi:hypothetical protein RQP46_003814 [Phenoliferia psychrophenolica]
MASSAVEPVSSKQAGHQICQHCTMSIGVGTDKKCLKCGGCKGVQVAIYCGTVCQRADWPLHKVACRRWKQEEDSFETLALSARTSDRVRVDLPTFEEAVKGVVWVFCRTILRLGRRDDLQQKKTLTLTFDYDPKPKQLRLRFTLRDAKLTRTQDLVDAYRKDGKDWADDITPEGLKRGRSAQRLEVEKGWHDFAVCWGVWFKEGPQTGFFGFPTGYQLQPAMFEMFGPVSERALRPNWEKELRQALRAKDQPLNEMLIEDMMASEDEEGQQRIAAVMGM